MTACDSNPKGNAAATSLNTKEICCCCIGLAGYLLNPPGERPLYRADVSIGIKTT